MGKWKDNKLDSRLKSRAIANGEKMMAIAVDYIRRVTAPVGKLTE